MDNKVHILISFIVFIIFVVGAFLFSYLDRRKIRKEFANRSGKLIPPDNRVVVNRNLILYIGIALILFGGHAVLFVRINTPYMIAVSLMLIIGLFLLLFFLVKRKPSGWLQFSERGITIGLRNGSHTIVWKSFQSWQVAEVMRNLSVLIILKEPIAESFQIESEDPNYTRKVRKIFSQNFAIFGAHVMIMLGIWDATPADIVYTLRKYTNDIDSF